MGIMARHTFVEILQTKIFWVMLLFSILSISLAGYFVTHAMILDEVGLQSGEKMSRKDIADIKIPLPDECGLNTGMVGGMMAPSLSMTAVMQVIGFGMVAFFSNLAAVFLMMGLIPGELSRRSIYTLISKPLTRSDIFLGKLLGGWAAVYLFTFILGMMFTIFVYLAGAPFMPKFFLVTIIGGISPMLFGAIAFVLGTFFRSTAVGFFSMVTLFLCTQAGNMMIYGIGNQLLKWVKLTDFVLAYLPPLSKIKFLVFNFIDYSFFSGLTEMINDFGASKVYHDWWANALFVAGYLFVVVFVGWIVFRQKEFN